MKHRLVPGFLPIVLTLALLAFAVAFPSLARCQTLEERVKEFTLANGMKFVVVERPVAPVFFGSIGFNVGSVNETEGKTGISHLLEHMLFKGTQKIGTLNYAKERKYLDKEDALAVAIAGLRQQVGNWRLAMYDDFARNLVASLPDDEKQKIGSDKIMELTALVGMLEAKRQMPKEAERYPSLVEDNGTSYYDKYVESKRKQLELAQVVDAHKSLIVKDEYSTIYAKEGGRMLNAFTSDDITAYFVYLPSNRLELWMAVESDRLRSPVFRELYQERDVVSEERRLGENDPQDQLWDTFTAAAFQANPYRRPVVGWMSDIQNLTRPDLQAYFKIHYAPNNAVAVLVGDVDVKTVQRLATRYFGRIPRQPAPAPVITQEPKQDGERRVVVEHTANPRVLIGYHIPAVPHPDSYAIKSLMEVLGSGRTSRLYKKIYEEQELTSDPPEVSNGPGDRLDNLLIIDATPRYPHTAEEVEKAIYAEIEAVKTEPPTDREMQRMRNQIDAELVRTLGSNLGITFRLGFSAIARGDWKAYLRDFDIQKRVKPEDVSYVAREYLTPENRTVATLVKIEEQKKSGAEPEQIDMKALMSYVRSLPESEQRELFQKFQTMGPEERKSLGMELMKRMNAATSKPHEKEAQGGK
jgi:predicted Zn-dependent peptidase